MANIDLNTTKASEIGWGGRAEAALISGDLMGKTLAEIGALSDEELLSVKKLGAVSLREIRAKTSGTSQLRAATVNRETRAGFTAQPSSRKASNEEDDVVEFSKTHPNLIKAIMSGEIKLDFLNS